MSSTNQQQQLSQDVIDTFVKKCWKVVKKNHGVIPEQDILTFKFENQEYDFVYDKTVKNFVLYVEESKEETVVDDDDNDDDNHEDSVGHHQEEKEEDKEVEDVAAPAESSSSKDVEVDVNVESGGDVEGEKAPMDVDKKGKKKKQVKNAKSNKKKAPPPPPPQPSLSSDDEEEKDSDDVVVAADSDASDATTVSITAPANNNDMDDDAFCGGKEDKKTSSGKKGVGKRIIAQLLNDIRNMDDLTNVKDLVDKFMDDNKIRRIASASSSRGSSGGGGGKSSRGGKVENVSTRAPTKYSLFMKEKIKEFEAAKRVFANGKERLQAIRDEWKNVSKTVEA